MTKKHYFVKNSGIVKIQNHHITEFFHPFVIRIFVSLESIAICEIFTLLFLINTAQQKLFFHSFSLLLFLLYFPFQIFLFLFNLVSRIPLIHMMTKILPSFPPKLFVFELGSKYFKLTLSI